VAIRSFGRGQAARAEDLQYLPSRYSSSKQNTLSREIVTEFRVRRPGLLTGTRSKHLPARSHRWPRGPAKHVAGAAGVASCMALCVSAADGANGNAHRRAHATTTASSVEAIEPQPSGGGGPCDVGPSDFGHIFCCAQYIFENENYQRKRARSFIVTSTTIILRP